MLPAAEDGDGNPVVTTGAVPQIKTDPSGHVPVHFEQFLLRYSPETVPDEIDLLGLNVGDRNSPQTPNYAPDACDTEGDRFIYYTNNNSTIGDETTLTFETPFIDANNNDLFLLGRAYVDDNPGSGLPQERCSGWNSGDVKTDNSTGEPLRGWFAVAARQGTGGGDSQLALSLPSLEIPTGIADNDDAVCVVTVAGQPDTGFNDTVPRFAELVFSVNTPQGGNNVFDLTEFLPRSPSLDTATVASTGTDIAQDGGSQPDGAIPDVIWNQTAGTIDCLIELTEARDSTAQARPELLADQDLCNQTTGLAVTTEENHHSDYAWIDTAKGRTKFKWAERSDEKVDFDDEERGQNWSNDPGVDRDGDGDTVDDFGWTAWDDCNPIPTPQDFDTDKMGDYLYDNTQADAAVIDDDIDDSQQVNPCDTDVADHFFNDNSTNVTGQNATEAAWQEGPGATTGVNPTPGNIGGTYNAPSGPEAAVEEQPEFISTHQLRSHAILNNSVGIQTCAVRAPAPADYIDVGAFLRDGGQTWEIQTAADGGMTDCNAVTDMDLGFHVGAIDSRDYDEFGYPVFEDVTVGGVRDQFQGGGAFASGQTRGDDFALESAHRHFDEEDRGEICQAFFRGAFDETQGGFGEGDVDNGTSALDQGFSADFGGGAFNTGVSGKQTISVSGEDEILENNWLTQLAINAEVTGRNIAGPSAFLRVSTGGTEVAPSAEDLGIPLNDRSGRSGYEPLAGGFAQPTGFEDIDGGIWTALVNTGYTEFASHVWKLRRDGAYVKMPVVPLCRTGSNPTSVTMATTLEEACIEDDSVNSGGLDGNDACDVTFEVQYSAIDKSTGNVFTGDNETARIRDDLTFTLSSQPAAGAAAEFGTICQSVAAGFGQGTNWVSSLCFEAALATEGPLGGAVNAPNPNLCDEYWIDASVKMFIEEAAPDGTEVTARLNDFGGDISTGIRDRIDLPVYHREKITISSPLFEELANQFLPAGSGTGTEPNDLDGETQVDSNRPWTR
jgi:hypothetical protein